MAKTVTVDAWLGEQRPETQVAIAALRALVRRAGPELDESVKWNAPSYADAGRDRVTLGVNPKGGYRIVLHRGAAPGGPTVFTFDDPDRVAAWPAPDRGVVILSGDEIADRAAALKNLIRRWLVATRE